VGVSSRRKRGTSGPRTSRARRLCPVIACSGGCDPFDKAALARTNRGHLILGSTMPVVVFANRKGGVGKTVSTLYTGRWLARAGQDKRRSSSHTCPRRQCARSSRCAGGAPTAAWPPGSGRLADGQQPQHTEPEHEQHSEVHGIVLPWPPAWHADCGRASRIRTSLAWVTWPIPTRTKACVGGPVA
jgi:hypothetical protein